MTERLWDTRDEWVSYALCGGNPDFTTPPKKLGAERVAAVQETCARCPVRPECIVSNTAPLVDLRLRRTVGGEYQTLPSSEVWVAGVWLPAAESKDQHARLESVKRVLLDSVTHEREIRPRELL